MKHLKSYILFENEDNKDRDLWYACANGDINNVKDLLYRGANVNHNEPGGYSCLGISADSGYLNIIKVLLNNKVEVDNVGDNVNNFTPLITAARKGYLEIVKILLDNDADINHLSSNGNSILQIMINTTYENLNVFKYLVKKGADIKNLHNITRFNNIMAYLKNDAWIESTLGINYDYNKPRKLQIIDAVKINPSIINKLDKNELVSIPELQDLLKSEEYGLFEIKKYNKWKKLERFY